MASTTRSRGRRVAGSVAATIDGYVAGVSPKFRPLLRELRKTIKAAAPRATESISYGIPTFKQDGQRVIYFSAATNHCAIHMVRASHLDEAKRLGFGVGRGLDPFHARASAAESAPDADREGAAGRDRLAVPPRRHNEPRANALARRPRARS